MGLLIILQVALDLGFIAVVALLLIERSKQRTVEDPRMSRGLQLLSGKIAVIQDLMDRSETLGRQLTQMIDRKQQDMQEKVEEVEMHLQKVSSAIERSHEVAKIFQDKIPHKEIIERQNTLKYVQAAKLAHQGYSADEIGKQFEIPRGELELIVKVNRDRLLVTEEPLWMSKMPSNFVEAPPSVAPPLVASRVEKKTEAKEIAPVVNIAAVAAAAAAAAAANDTFSNPVREAKTAGEARPPKNSFFESDIRPVIFRKIASALSDSE